MTVPLYFYGCDGIGDFEWGCCYRAGQMLIAAAGLPVPSIQAMTEWCGTSEAYSSGHTGQDVWIEPPDVARCFERLETKHKWKVREWLFMPQDSASSRMLRTELSHYTSASSSRRKGHVRCPIEARDRLRRHFARDNAMPVVVDNGISAYLVHKIDTERQRVHYMDPHATSRGAVPRSWSEADFWDSPLWMLATAVPR